jgi:hypothetical protein
MTEKSSVHARGCAVVNLIFGLWFLVPYDSYFGAFILHPIAFAAIEYFWGLTLLGSGIVMLGYLHTKRWSGAAFAAGLGFVIWLTVTAGVFFVEAESLLVPFSALMAAWCFAVYARYHDAGAK